MADEKFSTSPGLDVPTHPVQTQTVIMRAYRGVLLCMRRAGGIGNGRDVRWRILERAN